MVPTGITVLFTLSDTAGRFLRMAGSLYRVNRHLFFGGYVEKTNEKEVVEILTTKSMEPKRPESLKLCVVNKESDPEYQIHKFTPEGSLLVWRGKCNRETADAVLGRWFDMYTTRHK